MQRDDSRITSQFFPFLALLALAFSGCSGDPNRVLFLTTTQLGIDADTKSQSASIGFERYEGYVGPGYENGGVPPVIARLESNLSISDPKVSQIYATGDAARLASGRDAKWQDKPLNGRRAIMYFGTGTTYGLKASFSTDAPAFSLGYKRQEFSLIPIGNSNTRSGQANARNAEGQQSVADKGSSDGSEVDRRLVDGSEDVYPSVLASFDLNIANKSFQETGTGVSQFFATGDAAEKLAERADIRLAFAKEAESALSIRNIDCVEGRDGASKVILQWLEGDAKNKNTLQSIIKADFVADMTNWELINCSDLSAWRKLILDKHDFHSGTS